MSDATAVFANYLWDRRRVELPETVESIARLTMIDAIGCALAGAETEPARAAFRAAQALETGKGPSTVVARSSGLAPANAAFANTISARALLFDDTHSRGFVHAGAAMTFTALALAEVNDGTLGDVLRTMTLGVEIAARVGAASGEVQYAAGFHTTGTVGVFGTAAVASILLGLTAEEIQRALSLAGDHAAGLRQYQLDGGAANSALHAGNAARSGIACAILSKEGFPAPTCMIEGPAGFLAAFRSEPNSQDLLYQGLGEEWLISELCIKPYPNCRSAHSSATAIENLMRDESLDHEEIVTMRIFVSSHGFKCDRLCPSTSLDAQFSIQYTVACLLLRGKLDESDYTDSALREPAILELQRKIFVAKEESLDKTECRVEVERRDGTILVHTVGEGFIRGDPLNPMTINEVGAKFLGNARSSNRIKAKKAHKVLAELIHAPLEKPVRSFTCFLRRDAKH